MSILIVGAGEIGKALGSALSTTGKEILYWDRNSEKCTAGKSMEDMANDAEAVFFCVPSTALREAAQNFSGKLPTGAILVSLTKGLESGSNKTPPEVIKDIFPENTACVLGGPMLAEEMLKGCAAIGVISATDRSGAEKVRDLFEKTKIVPEITEDLHGLSLCGALKNIYSLSFGFAEGVGAESNVKGFLAAEALKEMLGIVSILGGKPETVMGPGGLGDLVASGMSSYGYNRRIGKELITEGKTNLVSEGILSLGPIAALLGESAGNYPFLKLIKDIVIAPQTGKDLFCSYISQAK